MFDLDRCERERCAAAAGATAQQAIREIVTKAVEAPQAVLQALGEPRRVEVRTLYRHTLACIRP